MKWDKKHYIIVILLLSLSIILCGFKFIFEKKMVGIALINNNISQLKEYKVVADKYVYYLPQNWNVEEEKFPGNVILHHNSFKNDEMDINGYIQIISTKDGRDKLIDNDKNNLKSKDINAYSMKNIKLNGKDAKKISYIEKLQNGKYYTKKVYYVTLEEGIVFKGVFNINSDKYNESLDSVYEMIMESGKYM
ncbi:hypothetical protein [Inconstantimicrobium mannanitabidum]|uniref:Uncharacterized protein n=1 Tax=Inconstantimicrobium mannanitabidum TaxID=1604901 RepID=A0ACB5RHU3_9CLOT|nr:hypothetical protein [Clostridium sp. TW13]GKX68686.1 hypothetical protein rsdtw13_39440 [Clostridium sp. TW13]